MHIELVRSEIGDDRLRAQLDTAKDLTRRAVEQLRSAIYALNDERRTSGEDLPSMLRRLSAVHMPDELRVEVRIGGTPVALPAGLRAVAVPHRRRGAVQHGGARPRRAGAVVRLAYGATTSGSRSPTTAAGDPEEVRRSLRAARGRGPSGEHRGLVNMQAGPARWAAPLRFRATRLGGLQVQSTSRWPPTRTCTSEEVR